MPARAPDAAALPRLDHDDLDDDARTMPPSSRTLRAIERAPSSIPPPQTRRALAMALGAIAVGVTAAVIGSVILRGSDVAALGLVAHLEEARSAVRALAAQPRDASNPRDDGSRGADAVEPNAPEPAAEAVADEPAEAVASTIDADRRRPRPTGATARDEGGAPSSPPVVPPAVPPPVPPVPPPAAPPPPKPPGKKPVDVFSERL